MSNETIETATGLGRLVKFVYEIVFGVFCWCLYVSFPLLVGCVLGELSSCGGGVIDRSGGGEYRGSNHPTYPGLGD